MSTTIQPTATEVKAGFDHPNATYLEAGHANAINDAKAVNFVTDNLHEVLQLWASTSSS
jgi:hypothetical protein